MPILNRNGLYCSGVIDYYHLFLFHISGYRDPQLVPQRTGPQRDPNTTVGMGGSTIQVTSGPAGGSTGNIS